MATDFLEAFGRAVRQLRQERGMTQAELAARLSLGRTSITNLEKGQQSPPLSMLPEIASALGVDPLRLIANAVHASGSARQAALAATVHDKDLRRWAGQVIGDTMTGQSTDGRPRRLGNGGRHDASRGRTRPARQSAHHRTACARRAARPGRRSGDQLPALRGRRHLRLAVPGRRQPPR